MATNPFSAPDPVEPVADGAPPAFRLADPSARLGARMVDNLALGATMLPSALVFAVLGGPEPDARPVATLLACVPSAVCATAFVGWQWYRIATDGTTLGKRAGGIRVVSATGGPPGFVLGVVVREWVLGLPKGALGTVGSLLGLVDALFVFSDGGRTLHDRLARTRVVRGPPIDAREPRVGGDDLDPDLA